MRRILLPFPQRRDVCVWISMGQLYRICAPLIHWEQEVRAQCHLTYYDYSCRTEAVGFLFGQIPNDVLPSSFNASVCFVWCSLHV